MPLTEEEKKEHLKQSKRKYYLKNKEDNKLKYDTTRSKALIKSQQLYQKKHVVDKQQQQENLLNKIIKLIGNTELNIDQIYLVENLRVHIQIEAVSLIETLDNNKHEDIDESDAN